MRDELEALIDETAQAMTDAPARRAIAEGVRARIAAGGGRGVPLWIPALATTALVLLVVVSVARWPRTTPAAASLPSTRTAVQDLALRAPAPAVAAGDLSGSAQRVVARAAMPRPAARPVAATEAIAPLDVMPLVIEPLAEPQLIAIDTSTQVMPIDIEPLRIEPIETQ